MKRHEPLNDARLPGDSKRGIARLSPVEKTLREMSRRERFIILRIERLSQRLGSMNTKDVENALAKVAGYRAELTRMLDSRKELVLSWAKI